MDLQGKIEKFNVPEIFQLISSGRRTGTLGIAQNDRATMFYFNEGKITHAYSPNGDNHLGKKLIIKGLIDDKVLDDSLAEQKSNFGQKRLGRILVESGKIDEAQLENALTEQISDIVYKVMDWDSGVFKFYDSKFPTEEEKQLSLSTESLILEGAKRADELNHLKQQLPDFNTAMKLKPSSEQENIEIKLSSTEWNILALCDGRRTIESIVNISGGNLVDILKALVKLKEADLIEPAGSYYVDNIDLSHLELQVEALAELMDKFLTEG
jgi:hypothetical protein